MDAILKPGWRYAKTLIFYHTECYMIRVWLFQRDELNRR